MELGSECICGVGIDLIWIRWMDGERTWTWLWWLVMVVVEAGREIDVTYIVRVSV